MSTSRSAYPLARLRQLLGDASTSSRGVVVAVVGERVQIATAAGLVTARADGELRRGQAVTVRGGLARRGLAAARRFAL
ncbi:hypothetical protein [Thiococcus pfennigii]|uniref:hypothetical protein n=1 Tax=Thiococcus pfennigii TaxID=1057 RepID=UPI00190826E8|nr:hypothetical protein [Thiococcus pfennigii]MBK1699726.1 hypothetical protein [Thiococcus pfennigii]